MESGKIRWRDTVEAARNEACQAGKLILIDLFNPG